MKYETSKFDSRISLFSHYYGDSVRKHLLLAAFVLMISILFDKELLSFYLFFGVAILLVLAVLAGITNPRSKASVLADVIISAALFILFEYVAIGGYIRTDSFLNPVFLLRQITAAIFLGSLYFGTKTLRGMWYRDR